MLDPPPSWHSLPSVSMTPLSPGSPLPDLVGAASQSPLLNLLPLFDPSMIVIKLKKVLTTVIYEEHIVGQAACTKVL